MHTVKWIVCALSVGLVLSACGPKNGAPPDGRPNVILIMTDDQGYGDLGFHGNPKIRTPVLDRLAKESVRIRSFYVSPVCSPTRASLMTGRYHLRTGIVDTYNGRSMMHPEEVTIAEMLKGAGYRTAIFGKWHLGDNHPMRPGDQGFDESLVHRGGGICQPAGPPDDDYFDPVLLHNGKPVKVKGYCSDVYTDAAMKFIDGNRGGPFFVYLAFNCPHTPLILPDSYLETYKKMNLAEDQFPAPGHAFERRYSTDDTARVYGMVENIDDNLDRLFRKVDALGLRENTVVIFLTDNGPQQTRYNAGMYRRKGNVHEGGIHVPCFIRWPARLKPDREVDRVAAHIDITPTLLEACGVAKPSGVAFDGKSLLPLLEGGKLDWPDRTLFFKWHRGDVPELYRAFAVRSQRFKLVQPEGSGQVWKNRDTVRYRLFDMEKDPLEQNDIAEKDPELVDRMLKQYEEWFKDVGAERGYAPPRIHVGTPHENPSNLTRQDWRGSKGGWEPEGMGHWEVVVANEGAYDITLSIGETGGPATAHFSLRGVEVTAELAKGATQHVFRGVKLSQGPGDLRAWVNEGGKDRSALYVDVLGPK